MLRNQSDNKCRAQFIAENKNYKKKLLNKKRQRLCSKYTDMLESTVT